LYNNKNIDFLIGSKRKTDKEQKKENIIGSKMVMIRNHFSRFSLPKFIVINRNQTVTTV
jgi:hypothetical protein